MPTQTELEFYKAFGIEGQPEITEKRWKELVLLWGKHRPCRVPHFVKVPTGTIEEQRRVVLKELIYCKTNYTYHAVRKIMGVEQ